MFRDEQAERRQYEERRKGGCEEVDPWFGHTATDVTYALHPPVPKHSGHPRLECAPEPSYNRTATDVTAQFQSRRNNPGPDYYYGRQDTDVTAHLQVPVPKFVNPHGCPSQCFAGNRYDREELQTPEEAHSHKQRAFDYMHPLGAHRPFPLSTYYFHSGSKPSTPCGSRSQSPHRHSRSRSPTPRRGTRSKSPRPRSRSPGRRSGPRSRSTSPGKRSAPRSRSSSPGKGTGARSRSPSPGMRTGPPPRSPSPEPNSSYGHLPPKHNIPKKYLQCRNRCQLSPPCQECARLLDEDRRCRGNYGPQGGMQYDYSPSRCKDGGWMKGGEAHGS